MDFDHENVRTMMNEDRLSSLPDELIHQILSCLDTKFVVQTSVLSSRWKLRWTSMHCLNFNSGYFGSLLKFSKFVKHVLSNRNHQIDVTSLKLNFRGAASQYFVRKIADYVIAHNVQEINLVIIPKKHHGFPPCLFSSESLKHFYLRSCYLEPCLTPKTPWDFPDLTTLHLVEVTFCDDNTDESVNIFSKCVKLKTLVLDRFRAKDVKVFDIITPELSSLTISNSEFELINLIAPKLEDLTIDNCSIEKLNTPAGLKSLSYIGYSPMQLSNNGFHSLNIADICLYIHRPRKRYDDEVARKTINMLQEVQSARFLTLNTDVVECISIFPELISRRPSPFSNLVCLNIDSSMRSDAHKVKMSTEARNFLLENSPRAKFIMEVPEPPPKKPRKSKEDRAKEKAKLVADIESHMTELQASLEVVKMHSGTKNRVNSLFDNLMSELQELPNQMQLQGLEAQGRALTKACIREMQALVKQEQDEVFPIGSKMDLIKSLLAKFPKQQRAEISALYCPHLEESEALVAHLHTEYSFSRRFFDDYEEILTHNIYVSSSLGTAPTPLTLNINDMP